MRRAALAVFLLSVSCDDDRGRAPCTTPSPAPDCVATCSELRDPYERVCANGIWVCPPYALTRVAVCLEAGADASSDGGVDGADAAIDVADAAIDAADAAVDDGALDAADGASDAASDGSSDGVAD